MEIAFEKIEKEFKETFGYVKQDIAKILEKDLRLHYTVALLACCACEMLAWHQDSSEDEVFTSLLPDSYKAVGKTLLDALRLKKLVADLSLDKDMLQSVIRKNSLGS